MTTCAWLLHMLHCMILTMPRPLRTRIRSGLRPSAAGDGAACALPSAPTLAPPLICGPAAYRDPPAHSPRGMRARLTQRSASPVKASGGLCRVARPSRRRCARSQPVVSRSHCVAHRGKCAIPHGSCPSHRLPPAARVHDIDQPSHRPAVASREQITGVACRIQRRRRVRRAPCVGGEYVPRSHRSERRVERIAAAAGSVAATRIELSASSGRTPGESSTQTCVAQVRIRSPVKRDNGSKSVHMGRLNESMRTFELTSAAT
ncbi:hypothetical protein C8R43DRAFT_993156 [Mycena crocata]|nr:hypothetical protein C8R43DRAFT_993156 [Mycena crocata]